MSVIKVKIHEATGMPAGKQKLQYEVGISPAALFALQCFLTLKWTFFKEKVVPLRYRKEQREWIFLPVQHAVTFLCTVGAGQASDSGISATSLCVKDEASRLDGIL